jgi:hypothetical protein
MSILFNPSDFSYEEKQTLFSLKYKGKAFVAINKDAFSEFVKDISNVATKMHTEGELTKGLATKASSFYTVYNQERSIFNKNPKLKHKTYGGLTVKEKNTCKECVKLCENYGISYKLLIDINIKRLSFVDNGNGVFPKLSQLVSELSEDYVADYASKLGFGQKFSKQLTEKDMELDLKDNTKFITLIDKLKNNTANLEEALYLRNIIMYKKNTVNGKVEKYIEKLEKEPKISLELDYELGQ